MHAPLIFETFPQAYAPLILKITVAVVSIYAAHFAAMCGSHFETAPRQIKAGQEYNLQPASCVAHTHNLLELLNIRSLGLARQTELIY